MFKIKTGYYLKLLTTEKTKLPRSTNGNITKNEDVKICVTYKLLK